MQADINKYATGRSLRSYIDIGLKLQGKHPLPPPPPSPPNNKRRIGWVGYPSIIISHPPHVIIAPSLLPLSCQSLNIRTADNYCIPSYLNLDDDEAVHYVNLKIVFTMLTT
jgi:hypothetical protein